MVASAVSRALRAIASSDGRERGDAGRCGPSQSFAVSRDLLDRDELLAAGAAVGLGGAGAVAWDLDSNATATAIVATGQLGAGLICCHLESPSSVSGFAYNATIYPIGVGVKGRLAYVRCLGVIPAVHRRGVSVVYA